jgi:predicted extracellular nuclease
MNRFLTIAFIIILSSFAFKQLFLKPQNHTLNFMFYNLENYFDTIDDKTHFDDDFTPNGKNQWNTEKYLAKINNLSRVLMQSNEKSPDVIGICEIESKTAIKDLITHQDFNNHFNFIHFDSPDERGIDVGLIYRKKTIKVIESYPINIVLSQDLNDKTRDLLYVKAISLNKNDTFHIMVCHFPSRGSGKEKSEQNRIDVAKHLKKQIHQIGLDKKWIVMGDFNDEPWDKSILNSLNSCDIQNANNDSCLLNLMWGFKSNNQGTYNYNGKWQIIDQMMITKAFIHSKGWQYDNESIQIIQKEWMMQSGKNQNYPKRNFIGTKWKNGFSDHLPIRFNLIYKND